MAKVFIVILHENTIDNDEVSITLVTTNQQKSFIEFEKQDKLINKEIYSLNNDVGNYRKYCDANLEKTIEIIILEEEIVS